MSREDIDKLQQELLALLQQQAGGMYASEVVDALANGYRRNEVRRTIQRELDRGSLQFAPDLRLEAQA